MNSNGKKELIDREWVGTLLFWMSVAVTTGLRPAGSASAAIIVTLTSR